jgi:RHS repeat-associated protein
VLRDRDTNGDGTLDERLYVVQDANYNVTAIFDNSGNVVERYVYDPFGQVTVLDAGWVKRSAGSQFAWQYLHQGGRFDATSGLYHFRHRDYSPTLGRWTGLDPIRYAAGDVNLYRALGNGPVIWLDPNGLDRIDRTQAGKLTLLWNVDEKFIGSDKKFFVGVLVTINGEEFVRRYVGGQALYVPLAKVNSTTSFWQRTPGNWDQWFRENNVAVHEPSYKNLSMQAGLLLTGYNGLVEGQQQIESLAKTAIYWNAGAGFNVTPSAAASRAVAATRTPAPVSAAPPVTLIGKGDRLAQAAKWIKPQQGVIDVVVHGSPDAFHVLHNGKWIQVNHRTLATLIKKSGQSGSCIRLISCSAGATPTGVAQNLANKLGMKVIAPTDTVWIHSTGKLTIGKTPTANTGQWVVFNPGGSR